MKNMTRRLIALLLTLAMLSSLMVTTSLAVDDEDGDAASTITAATLTKADDLENGKTYMLLSADNTKAMSSAIGDSTYSSNMAPVSVTLADGGILSAEEDLTPCIWTCEVSGGETHLQQDGKYLASYYSNMKYNTTDSGYENTWYYDADSGQLKPSASSSYYVVYDTSNKYFRTHYNDTKGSSAILYEVSLCIHEHADSDAGTVTAPTCLNKGYTTYTCTKCGKSYRADFTDALGHDTEGVTPTVVEATCTEAGSKTYVCARCGESVAETINALGHDYDDSGLCTRCGERRLETVDDFFAGLDEGQVTATYTAADWEVATVLSQKALRRIGSNYSNKYITFSPKASGTISFDYYIYGTSCNIKTYYDSSLIDTLSYDYSSSKWKSYSYHVEAGKTFQIAAYMSSSPQCPSVTNIKFEADCIHEHAADDAGTVTAPTCTEKGYTTYTCTKCEKTYQTEFVDALGHDTEGVTPTVVEATCTKAGSKTYVCKRCEKTVTETLKALGHDYDDSGLCTRCGERRLETVADFFADLDPSQITVAYTASDWTVATVNSYKALKYAGSYTYRTITFTPQYAGTITFDHYIYGSDASVDIYSDNTKVKTITGSYSVAWTNYSYHVEAGKTFQIKAYTSYASYYPAFKSFTFTPDCIHEHAEGDTGVVTAPTCTADGYTTYTCTKCNETYQADVTKALGHLNPVYTAKGDHATHSVTCEREGCTGGVEKCTFDTDGVCTLCGQKDLKNVSDFFDGLNENYITSTYTASDWTVATLSGRKALKRAGSSYSTKYITFKAKVSGTISFDYYIYGSSAYIKTNYDGTMDKQLNGSYPAVWASYSFHVEAGKTFQIEAYIPYSSSYYPAVANFAFEPDCLHPNKTEKSRVAATCTEPAQVTYTCPDCELTFTEAEGNALGHLNQVYTSNGDRATHSFTCEREGCSGGTENCTFGEDNRCTLCGQKAPAEVTIGDGTDSSNAQAPVRPWYKMTFAQMLYTASDVGRAGEISSLSFNCKTNTVLQTNSVKIYLGHTSVNKLSGAFTKPDDLTLVYDGSPDIGAEGWQTFAFSKNFSYNGSDNLMVVVIINAKTEERSIPLYYYTALETSDLVRTACNSSAAYDIDDAPSLTSYTKNRPNIRLTFHEDDTPAEDVYTINNAEEFATFATAVNAGDDFSGKTVTLAGDVDLSSAADWTPVGDKDHPFVGTFDGAGKAITGLTITDITGGYHGLFGYVTGTVKNFSIAGTINGTKGVDFVGSVVGFNAGTISSVTSSVVINVGSSYNVGGIAGFNTSGIWVDSNDKKMTIEGATGRIENCANTASILAYQKVGGIVGENAGTINACYNSGKVDASNSGSKNGVGGIAGRNGNNDAAVEVGIISNCYNTGAVGRSGQKWTGGIDGFQNSKSSVVNCYNIGTIVSTTGYSNPIAGNQEGSKNTKNNYSLTGLNATGSSEAERGIVKTADEMKAADFITALCGDGRAYVADSKNLNDGYPVLRWQNGADTATVTGLTIESDPNKLTYVKGESFDTTGMKIKAAWSDGTSEYISDYTVSKTDAITESCTIKISASYGGKEVSKDYPVSVITVTGIEITTPPTTVEYVVGQRFKTTGMVVTVKYSDNTSRTLSAADFTCTPSTALTLDDKTITLTYTAPDGTQYTAQQAITVIKKVLDKIDITTKPTLLTYAADEAFDPTGMVVRAYFNDGNSTVVGMQPTQADGYTLSMGEDNVTITLSYTFEDVTKTTQLQITRTESKTPALVDGIYQLATAEDLTWFASHVNSKKNTMNAKLIADITAPDTWAGIGTSNSATYFNGNFDGNGKTITFTGTPGLFVAVGTGKVSNVTTAGTVNGNGGVVATLYKAGQIENCVNQAAVSGTGDVGGVVGKVSMSTGVVINCHNSGTVTATGANAGGVIGQSKGNVSNCGNTGDVSGTSCVGGVIGLFGANTKELSGCYNSGAVSGTAAGIGGVVGSSSANTLKNCYNTGAVTTSAAADTSRPGIGGVIGIGTGSLTLSNSYNTGAITAQNEGLSGYMGQLIGYASTSGQSIVNSYYPVGGSLAAVNHPDSNTVTQTDVAEKTADEMKAADFVAQLNGENGTAFVADSKKINDGYPILSWQSTGAAVVEPVISITTPEGGDPVASVTAPADGWKMNEKNRFTVSGDQACLVAVTTDGGETYTVLEATVNEDGTYSFEVDLTENTQIAVALKGDANGDGNVNAMDLAQIKAASNGKQTLTGLNGLAADANGDGNVNAMDLARIKAAGLNKGGLSW